MHLATGAYFERTKQFWDDVHTAWGELYRRNPQVTLEMRDGGPEGAEKLAGYADEMAAGHTPDVPATQLIREAIHGSEANP